MAAEPTAEQLASMNAAKAERKRVEHDAQLLANRIALLKVRAG